MFAAIRPRGCDADHKLNGMFDADHRNHFFPHPSVTYHFLRLRQSAVRPGLFVTGVTMAGVLTDTAHWQGNQADWRFCLTKPASCGGYLNRISLANLHAT